MSISYGPNIGIMNGAADGDLYGDAMRRFQRACDAFLQPIVKGYLTNTPPSSPTDGDMYIIGSSPTGSWASYSGYVAKWSALIAAWEFYSPKNGWQFQSTSAREVYRRTGGAWEIYYQELSWTPAWTGLTITGSPVYTGRATVIGRQVFWEARISPAGGTTASLGGTDTYINNLPVLPAGDSNHIGTQDTTGLATCLTQASGRAFVPAWSAYSGYFTFSGIFTK